MESKYYLFTGQTLENTKVSDRAHALHITKSKWDHVRKHLDRRKDIQMILDKEERKKRHIYEGNKAMTDTWENSLEKIRQKKDANRALTTEEIQQEKVRKFYALRDEQEKIRKELIGEIKKKMFRTSGTCNNLNSAFKTSEALYERDRQVEFHEYLKKHEEEDMMAFAQKIKEDTLLDAEEKKQKAQQLYEKGKNYGALLKQTIQENADRKRTYKENQYRKEKEDNIKAMEEIRRIEQDELDAKMVRKQETVAEINKFLRGKSEYEKQLKQEEKELEDVIELYRNTKHRIECMKKEKQAEIIQEVIKHREAIAQKMFTVTEDKSQPEERLLEKVIAERDAIEDANAKAKAEFAEMWKNNRIEDYQKHLERREDQRKKKEEIVKWEKLNQYKNIEESQQYEMQKKKEAWDQVLKLRKTLQDQIDDNEEERKRLESLECDSKEQIKETDDAFFQYANEILEQAKKKGRNTYPIEKAILEYKKTNLIFNNEDFQEDDKKADSSKKLKNKRSCRCFRKK